MIYLYSSSEEDIYSWYTFANNIFKEFDLNIENHSNIDKSFEKVKYFIKTQLRKVATEKYRNKFKEKLPSYTLTNQNYFYNYQGRIQDLWLGERE
jgi:dTDP-4-dehydrorhamnose reductase